MYNLTPGAIPAIYNGESPSSPTLQCLGAKEIPGSGSKRVRLMLSDGKFFMATCMLASQLNHLVTEGDLQTNAVIRLNKYSSSVLQDGSKRVVICLNIDVLHSGSEVGKRIGEPVSVNQVAPLKEQNRKPMQELTSPKPNKQYAPKAPTTPAGSDTKIMPIDSLTPYQNRWTIKARVINKGDIREWKNARGEGKLFSFTVMDDSCDIRLTCFNEDATKYMDVISMDKVYYISNGSLKPANQQYNNTKHDYEMTVRRDTVIELCDDGESCSVAKASYTFVPIKDLPQSVNKVVDVLGAVKEIGDLSTVMIRSKNKETEVRNIVLVDQSNTEVRTTLWGDKATGFEAVGNPIVAFRSIKVSDFGGCSLSAMGMTSLSVNPDIPEAMNLKQWYESEGANCATANITSSSGSNNNTNWVTLADIKDKRLGFNDKPDYVTSKVTVLYCKKENVLYQACSSVDCNKKVVDLGNGQYRCEKCSTNKDSFKYRMILNMHVADEYDSHWVTCFQDQGEIILGMSSEELGEIKSSDENRFESVLRRIDFNSYFMKFRIIADRYNDEERLRVTVVNVSPVSNSDYSKKLLSDIKALELK